MSPNINTQFSNQVWHTLHQDLEIRRQIFFSTLQIDTVIDVGANVGQYAEGLRKSGFAGRIISFEPTTQAYFKLQAESQNEPNWDCYPYAIGDKPATIIMNISQNSFSSSILTPTDASLKSEPSIKTIDREPVIVKTLDGFWDKMGLENHKVWLKIDTQGFEHNVIQGALKVLPQVMGIEMEMCLQPSYEGATPLKALAPIMAELGFELVVVSPGFWDKTNAIVWEVETVLLNKSALQTLLLQH